MSTRKVILSSLWGIAAFSLSVHPSPASAQNAQDTRLVALPAVSQDHLAFAYANDLWVANRDGSGVRRLTSHPGLETAPRFSPDGSSIAFTGQYDGNADVFVVPVEGGAPERLTWHPSPDVVQGFTPDGGAVLFRSGRNVHTGRYTQLFTVPLSGGHPEQLLIPNAHKATYSPDGRRLAYTPLSEPFQEWKNYRGGRVSRIWLYDADDHEVLEIPQPEGRSNDTDPMWIDGTVYFLSDRNGELNLFGYEISSGQIDQLTDHQDFPVLNASSGAGVIVYEQAGYLHELDLRGGKSERIPVGVTADLIQRRARFVSGSQYIRNADISPSGARAVFEFRGDIITVPAEKGGERLISHSSDSHERSPVWSPDGKSIAYFSDASGEYALHIVPQDGSGQRRVIELEGHGFYDRPHWSPDGSKISYSDNSWTLYLLDVASGEIDRVASEVLYGPQKTLDSSWSPDSQWLAYTLNSRTYFQRAYVYNVETRTSHAVTDGLSDVWSPVFDSGGKYLYFFASTDAGPVNQWFAMSNADMELTGSLYVAVLPSGEESPLAPESDEEVTESDEEVTAEAEDPESQEEDDEIAVRIDFEGLDQRILALPVGSGVFAELQPGDPGQLYYLRSERAPGGGTSLRRFDFSDREEETLLDNASGFVLSANHEKLLVVSGNQWRIASAGTIDSSNPNLALADIELKIDPVQEWTQIYNEAWRINRDYFYDPGMHGADWPALKEKYAQFLPDLATRQDLNRVMQWLHSELAVGHHRVGGGDLMTQTDNVPGGLLGADFEIENGRYRLAKVYGGLNWNPQMRSPLTAPGVEVQEGEYLLAVKGVDLRAPENLYSRFENTSGKAVEITVGPTPDGVGSRTVTVEPIGNESQLRNRDWVEGNLRRVHEATDGRVAYVYLPNTAGPGHTYFKRYFFPQADKEAIIVDERYNGGGQVADYYLDILRRPYSAHWATRYGEDIKTPIASIQGPQVMLIDETAGSGGDLLPWMFRNFEMGPLIGKRTWGGLVGTLGFPTLLDGGSITAPNLAIWVEDGGFVVENVGVPPDIEVEQWPAEVIAGRDPQLERAIDEILRMLEADPPEKPSRPAFPVRVRR